MTAKRGQETCLMPQNICRLARFELSPLLPPKLASKHCLCISPLGEEFLLRPPPRQPPVKFASLMPSASPRTRSEAASHCETVTSVTDSGLQNLKDVCMCIEYKYLIQKNLFLTAEFQASAANHSQRSLSNSPQVSVQSQWIVSCQHLNILKKKKNPVPRRLVIRKK